MSTFIAKFNPKIGLKCSLYRDSTLSLIHCTILTLGFVCFGIIWGLRNSFYVTKGTIESYLYTIHRPIGHFCESRCENRELLILGLTISDLWMFMLVKWLILLVFIPEMIFLTSGFTKMSNRLPNSSLPSLPELHYANPIS